jgi:hypothetical protein
MRNPCPALPCKFDRQTAAPNPVPPLPARRPLGPAGRTPARIAGGDFVRAYDPARPPFEAWFQVAELSSPEDTVRAVPPAAPGRTGTTT